MQIDPIRLTVFHELFVAIAEEMGEVLRGTAPSVNIRERRDYSCALFDDAGRLVSQAAHIPVHLGSAALSVAAVRERCPNLGDGDAILLNDPYAGGTHLPDLTLVTPVGATAGRPWFVVTRAHHSDIGGSRPGSMAPEFDLPAEGLRIPPVYLYRGGDLQPDVHALVLANTRTPRMRAGDLRAQVEANRLGARRLDDLWKRYGQPLCAAAAEALRAYSARLVRAGLAELRPGAYSAVEVLEGDGVQERDVQLALTLRVGRRAKLVFDFRESADQLRGCMNANPAVVLAAVLYSLRCACTTDAPVNEGLLAGVTVRTRPGSMLEPRFPAAVAGGNVETSQRLVDLCFAALGDAGLAVPAQSAGTMNNLSLGGMTEDGQVFAFYETLGGGAGATADCPGGSGVQTHMTNTRNTPIEESELVLPLTIERYTLLRQSGGRGRCAGGDGIVKEIRPSIGVQASLLCERRRLRPRGAHGGGAGAAGAQRLLGRRGRALPAKGSFTMRPGDVLRIETPGGGGFGRPLSDD